MVELLQEERSRCSSEEGSREMAGVLGEGRKMKIVMVAVETQGMLRVEGGTRGMLEVEEESPEMVEGEAEMMLLMRLWG